MTDPPPPDDTGRTYSDRPPLADNEIDSLIERWETADWSEPEDFNNFVRYSEMFVAIIRQLLRERDKWQNAFDECESFDAPVELQKERAKVRELTAERDARDIQQTMYCTLPVCSAMGQVMFQGQWWCKQHAPPGSSEYADVPALRAEISRLTAERDAARAEIATDDKLLAERNRILEALPCPVHGACVHYVLEFIERHQKVDEAAYFAAFGTDDPTGGREGGS